MFLEYLAIQVISGYNRGGNIIAGRPQGAPTPHGPVRVIAPLSTVVSDYTTGLLYPFCLVFSRAGGEIALCYA